MAVRWSTRLVCRQVRWERQAVEAWLVCCYLNELFVVDSSVVSVFTYDQKTCHTVCPPRIPLSPLSVDKGCFLQTHPLQSPSSPTDSMGGLHTLYLVIICPYSTCGTRSWQSLPCMTDHSMMSCRELKKDNAVVIGLSSKTVGQTSRTR